VVAAVGESFAGKRAKDWANGASASGGLLQASKKLRSGINDKELGKRAD
jgi:hypothetical protein